MKIAIRGWQNLALGDFSRLTVAINCWRDLMLRRLQLHTICVDDKNVLIVDRWLIHLPHDLKGSIYHIFSVVQDWTLHQPYPKLPRSGSDCHHAIMLPDAVTVSTWGALKIDFSNMTHSPNQSKFLRVISPQIWKSDEISDFVNL